MPPLVLATKSTDLIDGILDKAAKNNLLLDHMAIGQLASACIENEDMNAARSLLDHLSRDVDMKQFVNQTLPTQESIFNSTINTHTSF